jgi:hypothetical protein
MDWAGRENLICLHGEYETRGREVTRIAASRGLSIGIHVPPDGNLCNSQNAPRLIDFPNNSLSPDPCVGTAAISIP